MIQLKNKSIQKLISGILATLMICTSLPITAFANEYNGTGGGASGGSTGGGLTWSTLRQGYRITIVDSNGEVVADPVDFVYSEVPSNALIITNSKVESFSINRTPARYLISDILKSDGFNTSEPWPSAMRWDYVQSLGKEGPIAQGTILKNWMMKGEFIVGSYPTGSTAPSGNVNSQTNQNQSTQTNQNTGSTQTSTESTTNKDETITLPGSLPNLTSRQLEHYKNTYINLLRTEAENYEAYGYSKEEVRSGLSNYIVYKINPTVSGLNISAADKQSIKTAVLYEYYSITTRWVSLIGEEVYIEYQPIPLASGDSADTDGTDGYIIPLLNYAVNGQYVFKIKGEDNTTVGGQSRVYLIAQNEYRVMIEPILWFTPMTKDKVSYVRVVYGTITNHAQWSEYMRQHGFNDSNIWHYSNITRKVGGWSLYIEKDEEFSNKTIKSPAAKFNNTISTAELADNTIGYALHVYRAQQGEVVQQTYDSEEGKVEHPAPDPGKIPLADNESPESRKINIVKTYEYNDEHMVTYYRTANPSKIKIMDEPEYKVEEWFISEVFNNPTTATTWDENKAEASATGATGDSPKTVEVEEPNTTLYVLLVKEDEPRLEGDLIIRESQITKAVETINPNIENWGPKVMSFLAADLNGTCGYHWWCSDEDCGGHRCGKAYYLDDTDWSYNHRNIEDIDKYIQADTGNFKAINDRGADATGTRGSLSETTDNVESFNYKLTIWRGKDIPTLASYKESSVHELNRLLNRYGNIPQGDRCSTNYTKNGTYYTHPIKITLDMDSSLGDYLTTSKHHDGYGKTANHININTLNYDATATVEVYWGEKHERGDEVLTGIQPIPTTLIGKTVKPKYSGGLMIANGREITWYPYIRMTYQTTGCSDSDRTNVNVLSQWLSELVPNDYVEAAWVSDTEYNMNMRSAQWSLHRKATQGDLGWNKPNRVLPGGAIYTLDTKDNNTYASVITWQPYLEDEIRNNVVIFGDKYTYEATVEPHEKLVEEATKALDNWRVVQYVKNYNRTDGKTPDLMNNTNITLALDGVKIVGGDISLSGLGLSGKSSTEDKYYMKANTSNEAANEGDIDILSVKTTEIKYKVTADVEGFIHVYRDRDNTGWVEILTLDKNQGAEDLTGEALALDLRTKVITNLCKVLTRNEGNDKTASWATNDGKWYNEAFDGICYVRRETCFELGYKLPTMRSAALDPVLCPENKGMNDLFSKAFVSQFFMNDKSDAFTDKSNGFIGSFKGTEVILPGYREMFKTMPFAIPNVNVQDIH